MKRTRRITVRTPRGRVRGALLVVYAVAGLGVLAGARVTGVDVWHPRAQLRHVLLPLVKPTVGSALGKFSLTFPPGDTIDLRPRGDPPDGDYMLWEEGARALCSQLSRVAPAVPLCVRVLDTKGTVRLTVTYEPAPPGR